MWLRKKAEGLSRSILVHGFSGVFPFYIVNEFPKSGGTWLSQMVAAAMELPFPRNRMPMLKSAIMHGHYGNAAGMKNVILLWRDPRDLFVSWYHHCLYGNEYSAPAFTVRMKKDLDFADIDNVRENLPRFIEYCFESPLSPRFTWTEFVDVWHQRPESIETTYEELRVNADKELIRICQFFNKTLDAERARAIADEYSFENQAGRKPGQEKRTSHLRKGVVGDWVNQFTRPAGETLWHYAGPQMQALGYAQDDSWIASLPQNSEDTPIAVAEGS